MGRIADTFHGGQQVEAKDTAGARRGINLLHRARGRGPARAIVRAARELRRLLHGRVPHPALVRTALVVRRRTGKSLASQMREIAALWWGPGRLRPYQYYAHRLYDDRRYSMAEKREFVGWKGMVLTRTLNDPEWLAVCDDKLMTYTLLRGLCLPHPEIYAVYHPGGRTFGRVPCLRTPEDMAEFLRHQMRYPFFGKPVSDWQGGGASSVDAIKRDRDVIVLAGGEEIGVEEYVRRVPVAFCAGEKLRAPQPAGYLFQERIGPHPMLDRLSGGRVSSLRLVVLLWPDGPRLFRAMWKLPVASNITSTFSGRSGNIKCCVDPVTGRVERAVQGLGSKGMEVYALGAKGRLIEVHPDTGERLTDVQLPDWERTVALCLHAAAALPGVRYHSWDLVMGVDGPIFLEVNHHGAIQQVPGCRGFNDAEFRQFMASIERT